MELVGLKELLPLTGYVRGGCSPLGMKKDYPTWIDETALLHERIYVNTGCRGMQVILAAEDLRRVCGARFSDLSVPAQPAKRRNLRPQATRRGASCSVRFFAYRSQEFFKCVLRIFVISNNRFNASPFKHVTLNGIV